MKKSFVFAALFALASIGLVFVGCGGGAGGVPSTPTVTSVTVIPSTATVQKGATQQFDAVVAVTNGAATTVNWTVSGSSTTINNTGLLSVDPAETATTRTVTATSTADNTKSNTATVTVADAPAEGQCYTPVPSPAAGAVASGTAITLYCATTDATIYYTTNGDTPTTSSTVYSATSKPTITTATTIKAIAHKASMTNSAVMTASYTIPPSGGGGGGGTLADYAGTYTGSWSHGSSYANTGSSFTLNATAGTITGTASSGSNLNITSVTVSGGGALVGGPTAGKWTYVYTGTTKIGIAYMIAPSAYLNFGQSGSNTLKTNLSNAGYNVSAIDTSDMSTDYTGFGTR
jgi:hypothetical protein